MAETAKSPVPARNLTVAVYTSDRGAGDAERASIMSQAGAFLARRGVKIVCPIENQDVCVPLIKSALSAGGDVRIVADSKLSLPSALSTVAVEQIVAIEKRRAFVGKSCNAMIGLPGSLASVTNLYETWVETGGTLPVALLNRNRAYEVMRGIAMDIFQHTVPAWEKKLIISESFDDLWNRLAKVLPN